MICKELWEIDISMTTFFVDQITIYKSDVFENSTISRRSQDNPKKPLRDVNL